MIPSITVEMIHERMDEVWIQAMLAWRLGKISDSAGKILEYDYLSHWQVLETFDVR